jgi:GNAT superfamily N-acetyltransferase
MPSRPATRADVPRVAETLTLAFATDPVWGVALAGRGGSTAHLWAYWGVFAECAVGYSTVFVADDDSAVSVWIPPDEPELSAAYDAKVRALVTASMEPERVAALFELWDRFEENHPRDVPHAYLSLLATHPDHRGKGVGQRLLAENLERWDATGLPAYLESTNPGNDHRYERAGFRRVGGFRSVLDEAPVSTMWRPPSGLAND